MEYGGAIKYYTDTEVKRIFGVTEIEVIDYWLQSGVDYIYDNGRKLYTPYAIDRLKTIWRWIDEGGVKGQVHLGQGGEERSTERFRKAVREIVSRYCGGQVRSLGRLVQERVNLIGKNREAFLNVISTVYNTNLESMFNPDNILAFSVFFRYLTSKISPALSSALLEVRTSPLMFLTEWVSMSDLYSLSKVNPRWFKRYVCRMLIVISPKGISVNYDGYTKYSITPRAYFRADFAFCLIQVYHTHWIKGMMTKSPVWVRLMKLLDPGVCRYCMLLLSRFYSIDFRGLLLWDKYRSLSDLNKKWQR